MKRLILLLFAAASMQGCAALVAGAGQTAETFPADDRQHSSRLQLGHTIHTTGQYPSIAVTSEGGHAVVMPPCGMTAVVVNSDGSHSIAVINGTTATIVTP